jgi:hypothetical protein
MSAKGKFVAAGAVIVVVGVMQDEAGNNLGPSVQVQTQGSCEPMPETREGLHQMQCVLLEAVSHIGATMISAPTRAQASKDTGPKIVSASSMPPIPKGFRM